MLQDIMVRKAVGRNPFGQRASAWKGKKAGYSAKHKWIQNNYGKANHCEKQDELCHGNFHWANISGKYKRDITDYMQLCSLHHVRMDRKITQCPMGHEYNKENTLYNAKGHRRCKTCYNNHSKRYYWEKRGK